MSNIAIVYWSGTGNTLEMAKAINEAINENGGNATLFECADFDANQMSEYTAIAFGCPAMGGEELEESEFMPMFEKCKDLLDRKNIALFGSYGWGDGEWMRTWEEECKASGATLVSESLICQDYPDNDTLNRCKELGKKLLEF